MKEKGRILVVDDQAQNLKLMRVLLLSEGHEVQTAKDANETFTVLKTFQPDLILMDIQLPGMDGLELTRVLKSDSKTKDMIIVAVTAFAMKGDEERMLRAGCDGYVAKPIDTRVLPGLIQKYLSDRVRRRYDFGKNTGH